MHCTRSIVINPFDCGAGGIRTAEGGNRSKIQNLESPTIHVPLLHRPEKVEKVSKSDLPIRWQRVAEEPLRALASRMQARSVEVRRTIADGRKAHHSGHRRRSDVVIQPHHRRWPSNGREIHSARSAFLRPLSLSWQRDSYMYADPLLSRCTSSLTRRRTTVEVHSEVINSLIVVYRSI